MTPEQEAEFDALPFFLPMKDGTILTKSGITFPPSSFASLMGCYKVMVEIGPNGAFPPWTSYAACKQKLTELEWAVGVARAQVK